MTSVDTGTDHIIAVRMCGPQSWGTQSRQETRDTALWPSKSGVVGAIVNASGFHAETSHGRDFVARVARGHMTVRIDCDMKVTSNHGITSMVPTLSGNKGRPIIWEKRHLWNGCYVVLLSYPDNDGDIARHVASIVTQPQRPVYMGRKCFPAPTGWGLGMVPYRDRYTAAAAIAECPIHQTPGTIIVDEGPPDRDSIEVMDQPLDETYAIRYVKYVNI